MKLTAGKYLLVWRLTYNNYILIYLILRYQISKVRPSITLLDKSMFYHITNKSRTVTGTNSGVGQKSEVNSNPRKK